MGGMTSLDEGQRYIVTLEVSGPKGAAVAAKVNDLVTKLRDDPDVKATVKLSINGQKPNQ